MCKITDPLSKPSYQSPRLQSRSLTLPEKAEQFPDGASPEVERTHTRSPYHTALVSVIGQWAPRLAGIVRLPG